MTISHRQVSRTILRSPDMQTCLCLRKRNSPAKDGLSRGQSISHSLLIAPSNWWFPLRGPKPGFIPAFPTEISRTSKRTMGILLLQDFRLAGNLPCGPGDRLDEKLVRRSFPRSTPGRIQVAAPFPTVWGERSLKSTKKRTDRFLGFVFVQNGVAPIPFTHVFRTPSSRGLGLRFSGCCMMEMNLAVNHPYFLT